MNILIWIIIFWIGATAGFLLRSWMTRKFVNYGGVIVVIEEDDKLIYSLELFVEPETIRTNDDILFKVDASGKNFNRN